MSLHFFSEDTPFQLEDPDHYSEWIHQIISSYSFKLEDLNFIFCSDPYLLKINQEHLSHDYYTDIITFDSSESPGEIAGDIFISIDRVTENAKENQIPFQNELSRVLAHGLLHLFGFNDKTNEEKEVMREKEDACISLQKK